MKKMFFMVMLVVFGTTALTGQDRDRDRIQDQDRTKLVMINGEMLEVRERAQLRLKEKQSLNDGTILDTDGVFMTSDGEKLRLRNGECLDSDGIRYRNEYQYRYKIQQENMGLTQPQIRERNQNRVHYLNVDGEVYQVRTETQKRLEKQLNLENGVIVNPDGTYQTRERKQMRLLDGECLNTDGEMYMNTHQYRKMVLQKNMKKNKMLSKPKIQKKNKVGI